MVRVLALGLVRHSVVERDGLRVLRLAKIVRRDLDQGVVDESEERILHDETVVGTGEDLDAEFFTAIPDDLEKSQTASPSRYAIPIVYTRWSDWSTRLPAGKSCR